MNFHNGQRATDPNDPQHRIWIIDGGYRRQIEATTYASLFADLLGLIGDPAINQVPIGLPLPAGAHLAQAGNTNAVFLVENNACRRLILSPSVFNRWYFNGGSVQPIDAPVLQAIPVGPDIT
jgi:hypothetical protein